MKADVGIRGETIAAIGKGLDKGQKEIDARGKLVLPGGVDSHSHIEQLSASGLMNADTFQSATTAAAFGGTTTVISFAAQHVGMSLKTVVDEYHQYAERGAVVDYAFHMILADPREEVLAKEVPPLVKAGHASLKVFMTYDRLKVDDEQLLNVLQSARDNRAMVCVHAENHGMISWMGKRLVKHGYTAPKFHSISHPRVCEPEAFTRLIACAALVDQPIMIFHVSTAEGAGGDPQGARRRPEGFRRDLPAISVHDQDGSRQARPRRRQVDVLAARARGVRSGGAVAGARARRPAGDLVRSRALRVRQDRQADRRQDVDLQADPERHAGARGAAAGGVRRDGVERALRRVASSSHGPRPTPAKIYGLYPKKGTLAIGSDADIAIWDPKKSVTFSDKTVKDRAGYTPWKGRTVKGWPTTVLLRGEVLVDERAS